MYSYRTQLAVRLYIKSVIIIRFRLSHIAEAEDALASMNRLNSAHTVYVLQYMAVQLEYMFDRKSHKWLSELRRMHDHC